MKKIALLFVVVMMLAAMSVTSFAANTATFATMTVDAGTTTATADYTFTFDEGSNIGMIQINLLLPSGVTLTDVDFSEFTALCDKVTNDNAFEYAQLLVYDDDMDVAVSGDVTFKFTFTLDAALEPGTYDIAIDTDNTLIQNPDGEDLFEGVYPATTLTVNGKTDPVKENQATISATKETLETAEATFENVAIYEIKCNLVDGATGYGFTMSDATNNKTKDFDLGLNIAGNGAIEYVFAFYNIEDASAITATPFAWVVK